MSTSFDYQDPKPEDFSSILFGENFVLNLMEQSLEEKIPKPAEVVKIWWDEYDGSVEFGFSDSTPTDFSASQEISDLISQWGFSIAFLNFTDGTQQHLCSGKPPGERKVWGDNSWRWNKEKADKYTL